MLIAAVALAVWLPLVRSADCSHLPSVNAPRAVSNDNRTAAGILRDGVALLRILAVPVAWYPEGAKGCALRVHAFAEEGKAPQIPGPLLRVRSGT